MDNKNYLSFLIDDLLSKSKETISNNFELEKNLTKILFQVLGNNRNPNDYTKDEIFELIANDVKNREKIAVVLISFNIFKTLYRKYLEERIKTEFFPADIIYISLMHFQFSQLFFKDDDKSKEIFTENFYLKEEYNQIVSILKAFNKEKADIVFLSNELINLKELLNENYFDIENYSSLFLLDLLENIQKNRLKNEKTRDEELQNLKILNQKLKKLKTEMPCIADYLNNFNSKTED